LSWYLSPGPWYLVVDGLDLDVVERHAGVFRHVLLRGALKLQGVRLGHRAPVGLAADELSARPELDLLLVELDDPLGLDRERPRGGGLALGVLHQDGVVAVAEPHGNLVLDASR